MKPRNSSYIGISLIILIFGIIFIPKIIDRIQNNDIVRSDNRSSKIDHLIIDSEPLSFLEIDGNKKKVPSFDFINQMGREYLIRTFLAKPMLLNFSLLDALPFAL